MINFFQSFFTKQINEEDIETQKVETSPLSIGESAIDYPSNAFDLESWSFLDATGKQRQLDHFKSLLKSFYLEEEIADFIDTAIRYNPLASKAYLSHLTLADTDLVVKQKILGLDEQQSLEIYKQFETEISKLHPDCNTIRDVSRFRLGHLIRYGVFSRQMISNPSTGEIEQLRILPAYNLYWKYNDSNWIPFQRTKDRGEILISPIGFIYAPLFPVNNDKGKFFIPPLLAGLSALPSYELFHQSIEKIAVTTGYQKIYKPSLDYNAMKLLSDDAGKTTIKSRDANGKVSNANLVEYISNAVNRFRKGVNRVLKVGIVPIEAGLKVDEGTTFEPPARLQELKDLIATDIILGFKSYLSIIGMPGQTNQTTLSETQKQVLKNFIETPQQVNVSIHKSDYIAWLNSKGHVLEEWEAYHQPPAFDSPLIEQNARKLKMENDLMEKDIIEGSNEGVFDGRQTKDT